jgi:ABC-type transport system involved in cytochrome c biogenesis permease subunit
VEGITLFWFLASYGVALGLEVLHQFRPRPVTRLVSLGFGAAGLLAHSLYLAEHKPSLAWQFGWLLFVAWILAIFYLYGSVHHAKVAWGVFVLPLVLGLVGLGAAFGQPPSSEGPRLEDAFSFATAHAGLLFLATVGVCVGFLASLMYLFQSQRLRSKRLPGHGLRLLSLERLEAMNRRAINLTFPLLTAGLLLGLVLMYHAQLSGWSDPRVLSAGVLWLAFAVMVYLRYGHHLHGRHFAFLTILSFGLLLCCLALAHPVGQGGTR